MQPKDVAIVIANYFTEYETTKTKYKITKPKPIQIIQGERQGYGLFSHLVKLLS